MIARPLAASARRGHGVNGKHFRGRDSLHGHLFNPRVEIWLEFEAFKPDGQRRARPLDDHDRIVVSRPRSDRTLEILMCASCILDPAISLSIRIVPTSPWISFPLMRIVR
jgi:hypothetical protein